MLARSTLSALVALLSASTFVAAEAVATLGIQGEGVSVVWTSVNAITQNSVQRITQKTLNQDPVRLTVRLGKDLEHPDIETTVSRIPCSDPSSDSAMSCVDLIGHAAAVWRRDQNG
jgi:hypothetical protein